MAPPHPGLEPVLFGQSWTCIACGSMMASSAGMAMSHCPAFRPARAERLAGECDGDSVWCASALWPTANQDHRGWWANSVRCQLRAGSPFPNLPSTRAVPTNSRFVSAGHCCIGSGGFGVDHGLQRAQQNEEPFRQGVGLVLHPYIWEAGLIECIVPVAMKELCCELCNLARLQSRGTFLGELLAAWER